jgi:hypothetical protein
LKLTNVQPTTIKLVPAKPDFQEPLVVCLSGKGGSGKSRFTGTAPRLGLIATETKTKQSAIRAAMEMGFPTPLIPDQEMIRGANPMLLAALPKTCIVIGDAKHVGWTPGALQDAMQEIADKITVDSPYPECCQRHYYRWHVNRMKAVAYMMAAESTVETIGVDSFGAFVDDVSYANYGLTGVIDPKDFGFAPREDMNKEIREFLNAISHKHLVLTHHLKPVWLGGKPTSKFKPESQFSGMEYFQSVSLEMRREDDGTYIAKVMDCQANVSLIGQDVLAGESITFGNLFRMVYPDAVDQWFEA